MGDMPVKPEEVKKQEGTTLNFGNIEIVQVKLLESIQNQLLEINKMLKAIATKQGAIEEVKTDV